MIALAALLVLAPPHARAQQAPPTYRSTVSAEGPALEARATATSSSAALRVFASSNIPSMPSAFACAICTRSLPSSA